MIKRVAPERRTDHNTGIVFDSRGELMRWHQLQLLARAGEITELRRQVKFPLLVNGEPILIKSAGFPNGREVKFTADFVYKENGQEIVEDYKAYQTDIARLRIALVEACCGVRVRVTGTAKIRTGRSKKGTRKWGSSLTSSPSSAG
jgi:hypothetical protein